MATPYEKGKNLENYIARRLREKEFYVARSAGSKGVFDLIAIPPKTKSLRVYGIQAKVDGKFSKNEIEKMKEAGKNYNIIPVVAYKDGNKVVLRYIGNNQDVWFW